MSVAFGLPAFLFALFCLIYSITAQHALYIPLPNGISAALKDRHTVFLAVLSSITATTAFGLAAALCDTASVAVGLIGTARILSRIFFILTCCFFVLYIPALPKKERIIPLSLAAITMGGFVIQKLWSAPVGMFFAVVSTFGCMVTTEYEKDISRDGMSDRSRSFSILTVALIFFMVIGINTALLLKLSRTQSDEIGRIKLDVIRSDLQDTISAAEASLLHTAIRAEQLVDANAPKEAIEHFIFEQRDSLLADESFMNIYIAGRNWHIVPDFDAPPDFHASERIWYIGAEEHPGEIFISEPYKDINTGKMCFTISQMLSDGETVVAMDLNFSKVQDSIREMTSTNGEVAMIVTDSGLIVGYTDMSLVGESVTQKLPEFSTVFERVKSSQQHDNFRSKFDGHSCIIFSSETNNHWYLILSVTADTLYSDGYRHIAAITSLNLLMLVVVIVFYVISTRNRRIANLVLTKNRSFIVGFADKLRIVSGQISRLGNKQTIKGADADEVAENIRETGEQLSALSEDISSYASALLTQQDENVKREKHSPRSSLPSRITRIGVVATLLVTLIIVTFFCVRISSGLGGMRLNREADRYENKLGEWITEQTRILYMLTDSISAQPEMMDDYTSAVKWLDSIASKYSNISVCYLANPYAEIPVIMNNGWIPTEDNRPETRPWYKETLRSANHFSISAPYYDVQTGNYCITFSRAVYGKNEEFLGIFCIDFFLDKMLHVLGESYTDDSYAFLIDSEGVIINHPNKAYENNGNSFVSIEDTEYSELYNSAKITTLRDYSGRLFSCLSRKTDSGFTVMVGIRWRSLYGSTVIIIFALFVLFGICIAFIVTLINRLIRWQDGANRQLIQAAEEAKSANRAKSQFLSQMSHEIRTPMNAIIGLDSIALRDPDISPHTRDELEKIGASARHLLALINDILDMSRIESGRMELKEKDFSMRELIEQINVIINGQCEDKGLTYECRVIGQQNEYYIGDDLKIKQVLINILGNSVKFTDRPGSVFFSAEEIKRIDNSCVMRFTIQDNGIGMDKEFLSRLFDAFSQENSASTNKYGGSGLGMAITKRIIDMMNGDITVESTKNIGTTFTVTIPLRLSDTEAKTEKEDTPITSVSVAGLHILIAEDQEMNAEVLTDLLEIEDMSSEWAQNGQIAVEMFEQSEENHFDAILMDMRMPVMDGLDATRKIRALNRSDAASIPIIALTANAFEEDVQKCLQAGMNVHMSKPVDIDLLKHTLGRLIEKNEK